jgi:hypothetical protein
MAEVDAFGTLHVDRLSKVTGELDEFADDADVLFVEGPREEPDNSDDLGMLLRNPALYLTGIILDWFWGLLGFFLTRQFKPVDGVATETVAQRKELDIEPVDLNLPRRASEVGLVVTVCLLLVVPPCWSTNVNDIPDLFVGLLEFLMQGFRDNRTGRGAELPLPVIV